MDEHVDIATLGLTTAPLPGAVPAQHCRLAPERLREACRAIANAGGRLVALWGADDRDRGAGFAVHYAITLGRELLWVEVPLPAAAPAASDVSDIFAAAGRMQRATRDLFGIAFSAADPRPWLRHVAWPANVFPMRRDFPASKVSSAGIDDYPFVTVEGDGVHEIPVGPVHAGTIEPGHFRFSIVGEKVLRLEQRLGYKHKGIEKRFEGLDLASAARLAGRVSGDSTCAYAWAFAMAAESAARANVPPRALALRALALERERIANHLGDLGALGNDAGLAFGLVQFMRLKEDCLRVNAGVFGHRYGMDAIVPGGVARDISGPSCDAVLQQCDDLEREVGVLRGIYDEHAGVQDRFRSCGRVTPGLAVRLGVTGLVGRASSQPFDVRATPGYAPYDRLGLRVCTREDGDVAARVAVRFAEILESLRIVRAIVAQLPAGETLAAVALPDAAVCAVGRVEGWRGEVLVALESEHTRVRRCHPHDPSWQNWPALEHAIIGDIVPDFPLINKSFNLSYAGHDL